MELNLFPLFLSPCHSQMLSNYVYNTIVRYTKQSFFREFPTLFFVKLLCVVAVLFFLFEALQLYRLNTITIFSYPHENWKINSIDLWYFVIFFSGNRLKFQIRIVYNLIWDPVRDNASSTFETKDYNFKWNNYKKKEGFSWKL